MSEPEPALTAAEGRHIKRLVEKTIKDCGMAIDRATGQYETINEQNALAMTILDGLTVADHVVMRLAQAFKRPVQ
jgi:hypothetical protein